MIVYHPPGSKKDFSHRLIEHLAPHVLATDNFLLVGDFNYHAEIASETEVSHLLNNFEMLGLHQKVVGPIHIAGYTLDLVFTNFQHFRIALPPQPLIWTDNYFISFQFPVKGVYYKHKRTGRTASPWKRVTPDCIKSSS